MKEKFEKIDRGTLLKGSGAAALLSMLAAAKADANPKPSPTPTQCCEPGNDGLTYSTSRNFLAGRSGPFKIVHGILLMKSDPRGAAPKTPAGYKPAYYIPGASGSGHDANHSLNAMVNKDIYVFVKM